MMAVSGLVENWQNDKSLSESLRFSLDNRILCDVTFSVGQQHRRMEAHKLILSLRSSVFMGMLNGAMAEQDEIVIPDIDATIFQDFLQFLYTDQVDIDASNVTGLLYAAKKYDVKNLEQQCLEYLDTSMTSEDACVVMEQAHIYDEHSLKKISFKMICENGDTALQSAGVVELCRKCLDDVIKSEKLNVSEETVFEAILNWSETACTNLGKEVTPENRDQVLGESKLHVRYALLPPDYFVNSVIPSKLLTMEEEHKIMQHLMCPEKDVSPFNEKQRNATCSQVTTCITRLDIDKQRFCTCNGTYDESIMFSNNKKSVLLGFQIYGARSSSIHKTYDFNAFVINAQTDEIMDGSSISTSVTTKTKTYDIMFRQPLHLKKNVKYCLVVNMKGPNTYCGRSDESIVIDDTITCSFFNFESSKHCIRPTSCTCVYSGQIPGLLFHV